MTNSRMSPQDATITQLSVVAPFYNEQDGAHAFYNALSTQLQQLQIRYDLVFVDDGSGDDTLRILNEIAAGDERVTVLALARNFGHQIALTAGLDHAEGALVVVMDSDLQHPPAVIPELLAAHEKGADIVYALRRDSDDLGAAKRLTADGFYWLLRRMSNITVLPGAADFRLMTREVVLALRQMRETHRYLRGMVPWLGFTYAVVPYDQPERFAGRPTYTWMKSLRLARDGLFSFSTIPLTLITWLGLALTALAGLYLVYILLVALFGDPVPGWTSVIVVLLVVGGVQLTSLGVLAQYVGMIFEQVKGRPLYVLKQHPRPMKQDIAAANINIGEGHDPSTSG